MSFIDFTNLSNIKTIKEQTLNYTLNKNNVKSKSSFSTVKSNTTISKQISTGDFIGLNQPWFKKEKNDLYDLRNINNKNFRGYHDSERTSEDNNGKQLSPSKSYFLTDYNFAQYYSDTNDNNTSIRPEVQKLILNQFQPYQMFTLGDILNTSAINDLISKIFSAGLGDLLGPMLKIGGKYLSNKFTFTSMKNNINAMNVKDQLYKDYYSTDTFRTRQYFTTDPVQVIQNMFNRRCVVEYL